MSPREPADPSSSPPSGRALTRLDATRLERDRRSVRRSFLRKLRRVLAAIPFAEDLLAAYFCAFDRTTPVYVRAILMGALAYFVLPADVIPDFVAGIGFTDDASVLVAAIAAVRTHLKPLHREQARDWLQARGGETGEG